ncbi:PAS domain S-box-containing protein [Methanofollis sp. W23]|nr:PAS domain S-box-containing protein [Methanofollis sp. W23]
MLHEPPLLQEVPSLLDRFPQTLCLVDPMGMIQSMNLRGRDIFCLPGQCAAGRPITDLFAPDERERFAKEYARAVHDVASPPSLYTAFDRNRHRFHVLPVFTPAEKGIWVSLVRADAVSIQHASDTRDDLISLLDHFPLAFFETDERGVITYANRYGLLEFGFTEEDLTKGLNAYDLVDLPEERLPPRTGRSPGCREYTLQRRDGSTVPVIISSVSVTRDGGVAGTRGVVVDISGIKSVMDGLVQRDRMHNLVASLTRHEQVNLLTYMMGCIDIAACTTHEPEVEAYLQKSMNAAEMIKKHLEFSRKVQHLGTATPVWQDLDAVIVSARSYLGTDVQNFAFQTRTGGARVLADPLFDRVFYILIENSRRHGGGVTEVRVRVKSSEIVYEDNGCGIPTEEKKKIFDLGHGKNTGLGLHLARQILGTTGIEIREEGVPGEGVRFVLSVPADQIRSS